GRPRPDQFHGPGRADPAAAREPRLQYRAGDPRAAEHLCRGRYLPVPRRPGRHPAGPGPARRAAGPRPGGGAPLPRSQPAPGQGGPMSETRKPLLIGSFLLGGLLLLVAGTLLLSRDNWFSQPSEYVVYFKGA